MQSNKNMMRKALICYEAPSLRELYNRTITDSKIKNTISCKRITPQKSLVNMTMKRVTALKSAPALIMKFRRV